MPEAVIVDAIRTPIGRAAKGSLKDVRTDDLAAIPLKALVERNPGVDFGETVDVMMGCGFQLGEAGYNIGRNASLLAGLDHHIPATTVNRFCASSLQTLRMAFHAIKAGEGDQYIAAGVEAVSRFPAQAPFDLILSPAALPWYYSWPLALAAGFALSTTTLMVLVGLCTWLMLVFQPEPGLIGLYSLHVALATFAAVVAAMSLRKVDPLRLHAAEPRRGHRRSDMIGDAPRVAGQTELTVAYRACKQLRRPMDARISLRRGCFRPSADRRCMRCTRSPGWSTILSTTRKPM